MKRSLALALLLFACAPSPQVDAIGVKPGQKTPALLNSEQLSALTSSPAPPVDPLAARAAALRARAAALRAPNPAP